MRLIVLVLCSLFLAGTAKADGERAGAFEYYVLSLSWAPNWCKLTGDSRGDPECTKRGLTFTLHGLWPQNTDGSYPSSCRTSALDPSKADTAAMEDVMGSAGLAWHEWKEHGRCSGLSSDDYLALMRKAYGAVMIPPLFARVAHPVTMAPHVIEDAFLESNPRLGPENIAVTCTGGLIQEVRICLTKELAPTACGSDMRSCSLLSAEFDPVR